MIRTVGARTLLAGMVLAAGVLGTGSAPGASAPQTQAAAPQLAPEADTSCDTTKSLPPAENSNGDKIRRIRQRGSLIVGVDQNSYNWGFRNPQTGRIEGFDIDLARAIAKSILGDPDKVVLKSVPTSQRIVAVQSQDVDLVVRTMTITCDRMKQVAFSTPYFRVAQRLVVPKSAHVTSLAQGLKGKRACVAQNSSSHIELTRDSRGAASVTPLENQLDCLVLMQQGLVDATLTDNVLAAAQAAQDPMVEVAGEPLLPAYMGVAMNTSDPDLVAWVNQVLVDYRSSGGWQSSYNHWLAASMGNSPSDYLP